MSQSKIQSAIESVVNVAIGYSVAVTAQIIIFPLYGLNVPLHDNLQIGVLFTIISLIRSYCIRRFFNRLVKKSI